MWLHSVHLCHQKSFKITGQYWSNLRPEVSGVFLRNSVDWDFHPIPNIGQMNREKFCWHPHEQIWKICGGKRPWPASLLHIKNSIRLTHCLKYQSAVNLKKRICKTAGFAGHELPLFCCIFMKACYTYHRKAFFVCAVWFLVLTIQWVTCSALISSMFSTTILAQYILSSSQL